MNTSRDKFWDIVKGIGIICIVLGHSFRSTALIAYVYLFHLPLFFFVSGYLYNEERYGDDLPRFIGQRIVGVMPRFMLYAAVLVLLHNPLVGCGAMAGELYNHSQMLWNFLNYAVFSFPDSISGALWFIPVWLISLFLFGTIVSVVRRYFKSEGMRTSVITGACIIVCIAGVFLMLRDMKLTMRFEVACAMVIMVLLGYILKRYLPQFRKYTKWYAGIAAGLLLFFIQHKYGVMMDLASNYILPQWFVITAVLGIILCLVLAEYIDKIPVAKDIFAILGRESFDIMALHFTVFKLIDIVYVKLYPELAEGMGAFPVGFADQLWWLYLILGLAIPAVIGFSLDHVKKALLR